MLQEKKEPQQEEERSVEPSDKSLATEDKQDQSIDFSTFDLHKFNEYVHGGFFRHHPCHDEQEYDEQELTNYRTPKVVCVMVVLLLALLTKLLL